MAIPTNVRTSARINPATITRVTSGGQRVTMKKMVVASDGGVAQLTDKAGVPVATLRLGAFARVSRGWTAQGVNADTGETETWEIQRGSGCGCGGSR